MSTQPSTESDGSAPDDRTIRIWRAHWQDEIDAQHLYLRLADSSPNREKRSLYRKFADVERQHIAIWERIFAEHAIAAGARRPSFRARALAGIGRILGPRVLHSVLVREEAAEVRGYLSLYRQARPGSTAEALQRLATESAHHAETLAQMAGRTGEPWHRTRTGGLLRNVVYGFNDGLTANFGLVAGVVGAQVDVNVIIVTGVAGIVADALSMGASGYLAAKSEREVYDHEIAMEREELRFMPEVEEQEIALLYQTKGMGEQQARDIARELMKSPEQALEVMTREELGIAEAHISPFREGWITGVATAIGALVPVLPFLILPLGGAVWTSFAVAMGSHFGVGAARSVLTGRGMLRSGMDMVLVGLGVAALGYFVGDVLVTHLFR